MQEITKKDNFYYLLIALITLLFLSSAVDQIVHEGYGLLLGGFMICLAVSIVGIKRHKLFYQIWYLSLLALAVSSQSLSFYSDHNLSIITLLSLGIFFTFHAYSALNQVIRSREVTLNQIVGSICVYILIGMIWAVTYLILLELFPDSFVGLTHKPWFENVFDVLYFSFITLTTVGYGDISPALSIPKFFVVIESIVGGFYLAILVASLVSSYLGSESNTDTH